MRNTIARRWLAGVGIVGALIATAPPPPRHRKPASASTSSTARSRPMARASSIRRSCTAPSRSCYTTSR